MRILSLNTFLQENQSISHVTSSSDTSNLAIYCMDLDNTENLLAVGTIDGCIKIYDMNNNLLLTTLDSHNGTVTCIKWSSCGRFLVSGSDDKCVIVWYKQPLNGTNQKSIHFQLLKRLIGHESDVQNISLNNTNNILMSCGLDCKIIIWQFNKTTLQFNKLAELNDIHSNFIKGCEFDPTGKYFATISDDKILKIYKFSYNSINNNFKYNLEVEIAEPFIESKTFKVTYFSKMHWSPNGQFLIIPNGRSGMLENCCILVDRLNNWDYSFKLIGNAMPIEVCKFNPVVFVKENEYKSLDISVNEITEQNLIIATGGQEKCLVLWSTTKSVPLIVLKNLFKKQISDLTWDKTGCKLFISSFDGDVKILEFEDTNEITDFINLTNDFEDKLKAVDPKENYKFLNKFGKLKTEKNEREVNNVIETVEDFKLDKKLNDILPSKYVLNNNSLDETKSSDNQTQAFDKQTANTDSQPVVNILVVKRKGTDKNADGTIKKRRVVLQPASAPTDATSSTINEIKKHGGAKNDVQDKAKEVSFKIKNLSESFFKLPRLGYQTLIQGLKEGDETYQAQLFNSKGSQDIISTKIGLNSTAISTVLPDTDLHTEVSSLTGHVFEIRNGKERKLIYHPYNNVNESFENLTKLTCFKKGLLKWEFFCKENITQLLVLNENRLCLCLDDHQLLILSIKTGLVSTNKIFFTDRILALKKLDIQNKFHDNPPYLLLIGENACLTVMTENKVIVKEVSISHLLYNNIDLSNNHNPTNKIVCLKKLFDVRLDSKNNIVVDLMAFDRLYHSHLQKYIEKNSHSKARFFKFDEGSIFKQLRKQKYLFPNLKTDLLTRESYRYSVGLGCWQVLD